MTMTVRQIKNLVGRRFFEVCFVKADGTERRMNCRCGVKKYLVGGRPLSPTVVGTWDREKLKENLQAGMRRWDAGKAAYRCFKPETVKWIKVGGKTYDVNGEEIA